MQVFAGQFIPFRSRSYGELPKKEEALEFGRRLWTWVLARTQARLFVCMGKEAAWHISSLTGASETETFPTG